MSFEAYLDSFMTAVRSHRASLAQMDQRLLRARHKLKEMVAYYQQELRKPDVAYDLAANLRAELTKTNSALAVNRQLRSKFHDAISALDDISEMYAEAFKAEAGEE